jgi:methionyl aminopeptidase
MNKLYRNDICWCGSQQKYKNCHYNYDIKLEEYKKPKVILPPRNIIKNSKQIQGIRDSGKINTAILDYVSERIKAGISTEQIDQWVYEQTRKHNAYPAPLRYEGFPKSVCTSINNEVCHGIPSKNTILQDGDIINVDVSTNWNGYFSDSSRMFCIGDVSPEKKRLVEVAKECLQVGLNEVKPWNFLGDMGQAIHDFARSNGYTVVKEIGGHGIGLEFHEEPWVSYVSKKGTEMLMTPGMIFTIEPMINLGSADIYIDAKNGWTAYTRDGKPSAQWEIQVLVTENGYEVIAS